MSNEEEEVCIVCGAVIWPWDGRMTQIVGEWRHRGCLIGDPAEWEGM